MSSSTRRQYKKRSQTATTSSNKKAKQINNNNDNNTFTYTGETYSLNETVAVRNSYGWWYLQSIASIGAAANTIVVCDGDGTPSMISLKYPDLKTIAKAEAVVHVDKNHFKPSTTRFRKQDIWIVNGEECTVIKIDKESVSFTNPERQIVVLRGNNLIDQVAACVYKAPEEEVPTTTTTSSNSNIVIEEVKEEEEEKTGKKCSVCSLYSILDSCIFCWIKSFLEQCKGTKRRIAIQDKQGSWYTGKVVDVKEGSGVKVHYDYFSSSNDEWIKEVYTRISVFVEEHFEPLPNGQRGDIRIKRAYTGVYTKGDWNYIALATTPLESTLDFIITEEWPRALATTPSKLDSSDRELEELEVYEVEKIVHSRNGAGGGTEYYVKWKNYPESDNSWEPVSNLSGCPDLITAYEQQQRGHTTTVAPRSLYAPPPTTSLLPYTHPSPPGTPPPEKPFFHCRGSECKCPMISIGAYPQEAKVTTTSSTNATSDDANNMLDEVLAEGLIQKGPCADCKHDPDIRLYDSPHIATDLCFSCFNCLIIKHPRVHKMMYLNETATTKSVKELLETVSNGEYRVDLVQNEYLSRSHIYRVKQVLANHTILQKLETNEEVLYGLDEPLLKECKSSCRATTTHRLNKQLIVEKLRSCGSDVFTICWDVNLTKETCKEFVKTHDCIDNPDDVNILFDSLTRTVTGILVRPGVVTNTDAFGSTLIYAIDEPKIGANFGIKTVTHRTIKWLIHNGIKYVATA